MRDFNRSSLRRARARHQGLLGARALGYTSAARVSAFNSEGTPDGARIDHRSHGGDGTKNQAGDYRPRESNVRSGARTVLVPGPGPRRWTVAVPSCLIRRKRGTGGWAADHTRPALDGTTGGRLKRHFRRLPADGARGREHLFRAPLRASAHAAALPAFGPAGLAAFGLIDETLVLIKLLIFHRECESGSTIHACQVFVLQHKLTPLVKWLRV